jgi:hypothetical protein
MNGAEEAIAELRGVESAFRVCVGELGMWSATRLFIESGRRAQGDAGVARVREALAPEFPVVEELTREGAGAAPYRRACAVDALVERLTGHERILLVGMEAELVCALLARLRRDVSIHLLLDSTFPRDEQRLRASWSSSLAFVGLDDFQSVAGARTALVTPVYGADDYRAVVLPLWMRVHGVDVRFQFRTLVGVNLLGARMQVYPRWLVETDTGDFTDLVSA